MGEDDLARRLIGRGFLALRHAAGSEASPPEVAVPPKVGHRFEVFARLGSGGSGDVYRARERESGRLVALKRVGLDRGLDPATKARLRRELRALTRLRHERIPAVHDALVHDDALWIVMELVEGQPLDRALRERAASIPERVAIVEDLARTVHFAHENGYVHRDLKPANVVLGDDGRPCLIDFGCVKEQGTLERVTRTGAVVGTPHYLSPEQASGSSKDVDRRSDVWALGAILYDVLAGRPPFEGRNLIDLVVAIREQAPRPLRELDASIPAGLEAVVARALAKERDARFESAAALALALRPFARGEA